MFEVFFFILIRNLILNNETKEMETFQKNNSRRNKIAKFLYDLNKERKIMKE